jgi:ribosomal protein S18 acetylase RimI-like enzyme
LICTLGRVTITIRPASAADLTAIGQVHTRARGTAYKDIVPADALDAVSADAITRWWEQRLEYEGGTHRMAVAQDRTGAVVGFTYVGPGPAPGTGELCAIHVDPDRQGGGVGRALMAAALVSLAAQGARRAVLWVLADNAPARRFYERGGWLRDGARRTEPIGPALTEQVRYWRPLSR